MIEGLRALPWLQERIRSDRSAVGYLLDCDKCMSSNSQIVRQSLACGYEPRNEAVRPCAWTHQGYTDETPTTCPGYTTKLPEVIEINRLRLHWSKFGGFKDNEPTENVKRGIEILEGSVNEANCWRPEK